MLIPPGRETELPWILDRVRHGETIEFMETERLRKDGRMIDVALTVSPIRDASGAVIGASTVARDMSEQKLAERLLESERRQLAEAQRIAKVGSWELDPATGSGSGRSSSSATSASTRAARSRPWSRSSSASIPRTARSSGAVTSR